MAGYVISRQIAEYCYVQRTRSDVGLNTALRAYKYA